MTTKTPKKKVVKTVIEYKCSPLVSFVNRVSAIINSDDTTVMARNKPVDFTRHRCFSSSSTIMYFAFRHRTNTGFELNSFFSDVGKLKNRISRQALFANGKKLNPYVFRYLTQETSKEFYKSELVKKLNGYIVLAEDGTTIEVPDTPDAIRYYTLRGNGKLSIADQIEDAKRKIKLAMLYDVLNGNIIDFTYNNFNYSEIPMCMNHLYTLKNHVTDDPGKYLLLADRYYPSLKIFSFIEYMGMKYCIRGKKNFYKNLVKEMKSDDEVIEVTPYKLAFKELSKYPECEAYFKENESIKIRVVRHRYKYTDKDGKEAATELLYFTNLSKDEFSAEDIIDLYSRRWGIETDYKNLKSILEIERHISTNLNIAECCILGKIFMMSIFGIIGKEIDDILRNVYMISKAEGNADKYQYEVNTQQMIDVLRKQGILDGILNGRKRKIRNAITTVIELLNKIKVPIRPDRHYPRWNKYVVSPPKNRYRIDGREHAKVKRFKGIYRTVRK